MDLGLTGKRALVLGASQGLGRAIAAELVAEGAVVAIASRDTRRIGAAATDMGAALALTCDLTVPGAAAEAVQATIAQLGGIDILVCNSGGPPKAGFADVDDAAWLAGFQLLWLSTAEAMRQALPAMQAQGFGRVLVVTSIAAKEPLPGLVVSNGLRAGLLGLVKDVSRDVAKDGVTINALLPGYTRTERMAQLGVTDAQVATSVPAGRMGEPEEFAALAVFLASTRAGYINGQAIAVDGGWLRGQ
jgi:3-oxoacyl-[acyl-carrier protein] reductase